MKRVIIHSYHFDAMLFSFDLVKDFFQNRVTLRMLEFLCREPLNIMHKPVHLFSWVRLIFGRMFAIDVYRLEVYIPEPDPTRKSGSFGLACDYVGSGSDFNFRVEIGFKVIVFKFSFGNKLCSMKFQVL